MTYVLGIWKGQKFIQCLVCGMRSFHPMDISERFCGFCKRWHK